MGCRHRKDLAGAITREAAPHRCRIAGPVAGAQALGDDDVERLPERLALGKSEDPLRAVIPKANNALASA